MPVWKTKTNVTNVNYKSKELASGSKKFLLGGSGNSDDWLDSEHFSITR